MSHEAVAAVTALIELGMIAQDDIVKCLKKALSEPASQRTWVDLTDEQMWNAYTGGSDIINLDYAKNIVALFKEKNT